MKKIPFEKIYLVLALIYTCVFPIYMMLSFKLGYQYSIFENLNYFLIGISLLTLLVFLTDTVINQNNIFKIKFVHISYFSK